MERSIYKWIFIKFIHMVISKESLQIGSLYILMHAHGYFIGKLIGTEKRHSVKLVEVKVNGVVQKTKEIGIPCYTTAILKGIDTENIERFGVISKRFNSTFSRDQIYLTNSILFDNLFVKIDSLQWLTDHMLKLNEFKIDKRNSKISCNIALSMFYKESPLASKHLTSRFIKPLFNKISENIADEIEARVEAVKLSQINQLPF